jgi:hypothetical protein
VKLRKHVGLYEKQLKTDDDDGDYDDDLFNDASNNLDYKVECMISP